MARLNGNRAVGCNIPIIIFAVKIIQAYSLRRLPSSRIRFRVRSK